MAINLQKGQRISLSKEAPSLTKLMCGLGWDIAENTGGGGFFSMFASSPNYDLDASVICLSENGKLTSTNNVIYYNNLQHSSNSVMHQGDNLTGAGEGDDEIIIVDLPRIPSEIYKLVFIVSIYDCVSRKQDFSQVENAFVRLVNLDNKQELARYNLSGKDYVGMTGMILAEVYRHNGDWKMAAIGNGIKASGLKEIIQKFT